MTRVFLAAGVAALAIAVPAAAKPGGGHGGGHGGGQQAAAVQNGGGGGGGQRAQKAERRGGGGGFSAQQVQRVERRGGGFNAMRAQRVERQQFRAPKLERRSQMRVAGFGPDRSGRAAKAERRVRTDFGAQRFKSEQRVAKQHRNVERFKTERAFANQRVKSDQRLIKQQNRQLERFAVRDRIRTERVAQVRGLDSRLGARAMGFGVGNCPPGLMSKGCVPPGHGINAANRIANADAFRLSRLSALNYGAPILAPMQVQSFVGSPLTSLGTLAALSALPQPVQYLYPDTDDYYYRYGNGYLYHVDRGDNLIASILPLLAGGLLPGQYLPTSYMNSYVPDYYGLNSFYPANYGYNPGYAYNSGYGLNAGYGGYDTCNRYANGVVYQVDCVTGMIMDVIPVYAGGYGVGQMLPSSYSYYNVPTQYRSLYYNTPDANYWYAPGAIYQYDPSSSMITSVAALLSPGMTIGQPLPMGYSAYNVPLGYRDTYYDTPNAWYRYNNGYIYQVDPMTQLVTAIVASILT